MLLSALLRRYVEGDHVGFQVRFTLHNALPTSRANVNGKQMPSCFPSGSTIY